MTNTNKTSAFIQEMTIFCGLSALGLLIGNAARVLTVNYSNSTFDES
ncbi:hypothetical protein KAI46_06480 [bacterium]|nr:hypothetical protein [bacterium]